MDLITRKELLSIVPYSMTHIDRLEADGKFPRRVKLGDGRGGRVAWVRSEINDWLGDLILNRRQSA